MIETVTTVVRTSATVALTGSLGVVAVVALVLMIIAREVSVHEQRDIQADGILPSLGAYLLIPVSSLTLVLVIIVLVTALRILLTGR